MIDHCNHSPAGLPVSSSISCICVKQVSDHINLLLKNLPELPVAYLLKCKPLTQGPNEVSPQCLPNSHFFSHFPVCACVEQRFHPTRLNAVFFCKGSHDFFHHRLWAYLLPLPLNSLVSSINIYSGLSPFRAPVVGAGTQRNKTKAGSYNDCLPSGSFTI